MPRATNGSTRDRLAKKSVLMGVRLGNYLKGMTKQEKREMDAAIASRVTASFNNLGLREMQVRDRVQITLRFGLLSNLRVEQKHMDEALKMKGQIQTEKR
jgi:prephenate dehydratase